MKTYFSTFITGFSEIIEQSLKSSLHEVEIQNVFDGLVIYRTDVPIEEISKLRFLNNSFILLENLKGIGPDLINPFVKQVIKNCDFDKLIGILPKKEAGFRIIISKENEIVKIHSDILKKIENTIAETSHWEINRANPDFEFWFILRKEGFGLFGLRFTNHSNHENILEKGELRPELANILCLISQPSEDDVFLDPFTGFGSIPIERTHFPFTQIFAGDVNPSLVDKLRVKAKKLNKQISIHEMDATNLEAFNGKSVNKIVTDPPWGLYNNTELDLPDLYTKMLRQFYRVLKENGILVLVVSDKELVEKALKQFSNRYMVLNTYTTLVNGKKANVFKMRKIIV